MACASWKLRASASSASPVMPGMRWSETTTAMSGSARRMSSASSGLAEVSAVIAALNRGGIIGYVAKPWDPTLLRATVRNAYIQEAAQQGPLGGEIAAEAAALIGVAHRGAQQRRMRRPYCSPATPTSRR
jgi:response regulator RpfG family c-di-GMP phosphodiesterase